MTTDPKRDSIIARLRKLAAMTTERGASEAEATRAAELLAKMMSEHNIGRDEIQLKLDAQGCITDGLAMMEASYAEWKGLPGAISALFECRAFFDRKMEDPLDLGELQPIIYLQFFGFPADVIAATALLGICVTAVNTESSAWKPTVGTRRTNARVQDFRLGMIHRLTQRIQELAKPPVQATGTGLIVLKNQLVRDAMRQAHPDLGHAGAGLRPRDAASYAAGQSAGDRISIARHHLTGQRQLPGR